MQPVAMAEHDSQDWLNWIATHTEAPPGRPWLAQYIPGASEVEENGVTASFQEETASHQGTTERATSAASATPPWEANAEVAGGAAPTNTTHGSGENSAAASPPSVTPEANGGYQGGDLVDYSRFEISPVNQNAGFSGGADNEYALPQHADGESPAPITYVDIGGNSEAVFVDPWGWYDWDMGVRKTLGDWFLG